MRAESVTVRKNYYLVFLSFIENWTCIYQLCRAILHMNTTTIERTIELTGNVLEDTDNSEHKFKLRTAIQLLEIIKGRHDAASDVLADCELDKQVQENLKELGYLE
jgi:hypothetical protein